MSENVQKFKIGIAPASQLEACYSIVSPPKIPSNVMHEVECIRLCDEALCESLKNYKIRLNSTSILECIFEECGIPLQDRVGILHEISNGSCKNDAMNSWISIEGTCEKVEECIERKKPKLKQKFFE